MLKNNTNYHITERLQQRKALCWAWVEVWRGLNNGSCDPDQPDFIVSTEVPVKGYHENNKNTWPNIFKMA